MSVKQYAKQGTPPNAARKKKATSHQRTFHRKSRHFRTGLKAAVLIGVAIVLLGVIYALNAGSGSSASTNSTGKYPFVVGNPGPSRPASIDRWEDL